MLGQLGVEDAAVVAHSWGSSVALELALQAPGRVRGLALYDAWVYEEQLPAFFLWARAPGVGEHEVFHLRVCMLVPGLAEQNHHYDPFDLLDVYVVGIEREQPVDDELPLGRAQDADLLEVKQVSTRCRIEPLLLRAVINAHRH